MTLPANILRVARLFLSSACWLRAHGSILHATASAQSVNMAGPNIRSRSARPPAALSTFIRGSSPRISALSSRQSDDRHREHARRWRHDRDQLALQCRTERRNSLRYRSDCRPYSPRFSAQPSPLRCAQVRLDRQPRRLRRLGGRLARHAVQDGAGHARPRHRHRRRRRGSDITIWPNLLRGLTGAKIKLVNGYIGTSGVALAMERGEVQGMIGPDWDGLGEQIRLGARQEDWTFAADRAAKASRSPGCSQHSRFSQEFSGSRGSRLIHRQKYSRPFAGPPGLSASVVEAYRTAFKCLAQIPNSWLRRRRPTHPSNGSMAKEILQSPNAFMKCRPPALIERATQELAKASK